MKQRFCAIVLAGCSLLWPHAALHAEESGTTEQEAAERTEISSEDLQVVQMMELLELMELLEDMELLEGEIKAVLEEEK